MASSLYICASTNRYSHAAAVSSLSQVAFGSSNVVAFWDTSTDQDLCVDQTLPSHEGLITAVRFLSETSLTSGDNKGVLRIWRKDDTAQWTSTCCVVAHDNPISSLCIHTVDGAKNTLIITGSSDASVKIWKLSWDADVAILQEVQKLSLKGKYPMAMAISCLPRSEALMLAIGGTGRNIEIWTRSEDVFIHSLTLPGHEDWIRGLAFHVDENDTLVLASGSQDATIRLWNIEPVSKAQLPVDADNTAHGPISNDPLSDELLDAFEASLGEVGDAEEGGKQISLKRHVFTIKTDPNNSRQYSLTFDALLVGHEAGITSLAWRQPSQKHLKGKPTLLTTSTDSSIILWSPSDVVTSSSSASSSIWINRQRFGDIGGQRLGGFIGGLWGRNGEEVLAWGWAGGWRRWRCSSSPQAGSDPLAEEKWFEVGAVSGHNGPVKGISWSPNGEYIVSAGTDQTTRIHGPIQNAEGHVSWHELARPQVHGYDMVDVSFLTPLTFVSIADEKVIRVFEAPKTFVETVEGLGVVKFSDAERNRPAAASVPPLGLSNKAVSGVPSRLTEVVEPTFSVRRPFEGELAATTLWPETEKVFGHGYESISLASSTSKHLIATACRATSAEHAIIRIYDTAKYKLVGNPLQGHSLTVTRIAFSPDDRYILSVSRDRSWVLSEVQPNGGYVPITADKSHGRIIWDCAWANEGDIFATASRDKTVKIWHLKDNETKNKWSATAVIKTKEAATAVDFCSPHASDSRVLAIGLESGEILIYGSYKDSSSDWKLRLTLNTAMAHIDHVHRLAWRPSSKDGRQQLASCSEDGILKILNIDLKDGGSS